MNSFKHIMKTKIYFGENEITNLSEIIRENYSLPFKNALIVTGKKSAKKNGYVNNVIDQLSKLHINSYHFSEISPNPKTDEIDKCVEFSRKYNAELIIGLGGGSVLDAAKVVSAMAQTNNFSCSDILLGKKSLFEKRMPLIQIPTTAGTGSELSMGAIVTDELNGIKTGIRGEVLLADIALIDPVLTYSKSLKLTVETGFDILTHGIETFFSKKSTPFTEIYSIEAINRVLKYIPMIKNNQNCKEARRELAFASLLMGSNLVNSSTCLPHRMQYPIGSLTETSHPLGLASIYSSWLKYSLIFNEDKFLKLAFDLGYKNNGILSPHEQLYKDIESFIEYIGLKVGLGDLGINKEQLPILINKVEGNLQNDPISRVDGIIEKIYKNSF